MGRPRARLLLLALVLALSGACRLDVNVGVVVHDDGSGEVRVAVALDADAARRVPDLKDQLEVGDLRRSGWRITGPALEGDGRTWIRASKRFASPEQAGQVLAEVSGKDGPFRDFVVERHDTLLKTTWRFRGQVDLRGGLRGFSDDSLRQRLDNTDVGMDTTEIERLTGTTLDRIFRFRVATELPGSVSANAPTVVSGGAVWRPALGEDIVLSADASAWRTDRIAWLAGSAAAVAALGIVVGARLGRRRRAA